MIMPSYRVTDGLVFRRLVADSPEMAIAEFFDYDWENQPGGLKMESHVPLGAVCTVYRCDFSSEYMERQVPLSAVPALIAKTGDARSESPDLKQGDDP